MSVWDVFAPLDRKSCPLNHSTKLYDDFGRGAWRRGDDEALFVINLVSGGRHYKMACRSCGQRSGAVPTAVVEKGWRIADQVEWEENSAPREYDPCVVKDCTVTPTEYHHFAPRNTFGAECDQWPCLPLCREHHVDWHQRMDGYSWHRKGAVA